jgi:hypothetical protein
MLIFAPLCARLGRSARSAQCGASTGGTGCDRKLRSRYQGADLTGAAAAHLLPVRFLFGILNIVRIVALVGRRAIAILFQLVQLGILLRTICFTRRFLCCPLLGRRCRGCFRLCAHRRGLGRITRGRGCGRLAESRRSGAQASDSARMSKARTRRLDGDIFPPLFDVVPRCSARCIPVPGATSERTLWISPLREVLLGLTSRTAYPGSRTT